jgi:chaperone modulatory protein CbpM
MEEEVKIPVKVICERYSIEPSFFVQLKDFSLIEFEEDGDNYFVSHDQLSELERFIRLHYELEINMQGIDVIRHLLARIDALEKKISTFNNR